MSEPRPGGWPVDQPTDTDGPAVDERYLQRTQETALHDMVMDSVMHDLAQQPSPGSVRTAARAWCARITAAADEIARTKRSSA